MFTNDNPQLLVAELSEVEQLLNRLSSGAISSRRTLQSRKKALLTKLTQLAEQPDTAAFVELLFSGAPVIDSRAIDASFAADALHGYQDLITKATAVKNGGLGSRGVVAGAATESSRFFLTGVARGSFGFTLEENIERGTPLFNSTLKTVVEDVSAKLTTFCNNTDNEYDTFIQEIDKRLFSSFKSFFKLLHDAGAQLKVVDRQEGRIFDAASIDRAFIRTEATQFEEEELNVVGLLTGLADGMFNFLSNNQTSYSGRLAPTFGLSYRSQVESTEFTYQLGKRYSAQLVKRSTKRGGAATHFSYFLIDLLEAENSNSE